MLSLEEAVVAEQGVYYRFFLITTTTTATTDPRKSERHTNTQIPLSLPQDYKRYYEFLTIT